MTRELVGAVAVVSTDTAADKELLLSVSATMPSGPGWIARRVRSDELQSFRSDVAVKGAAVLCELRAPALVGPRFSWSSFCRDVLKARERSMSLSPTGPPDHDVDDTRVRVFCRAATGVALRARSSAENPWVETSAGRWLGAWDGSCEVVPEAMQRVIWADPPRDRVRALLAMSSLARLGRAARVESKWEAVKPERWTSSGQCERSSRGELTSRGGPEPAAWQIDFEAGRDVRWNGSCRVVSGEACIGLRDGESPTSVAVRVLRGWLGIWKDGRLRGQTALPVRDTYAITVETRGPLISIAVDRVEVLCAFELPGSVAALSVGSDRGLVIFDDVSVHHRPTRVWWTREKSRIAAFGGHDRVRDGG